MATKWTKITSVKLSRPMNVYGTDATIRKLQAVTVDDIMSTSSGKAISPSCRSALSRHGDKDHPLPWVRPK